MRALRAVVVVTAGLVVGARALGEDAVAPVPPQEASAGLATPGASGCGVDAALIAVVRNSASRPTWRQVQQQADPDEDGISSLADVASALVASQIPCRVLRSSSDDPPRGPSILHIRGDASRDVPDHLIYAEPHDGAWVWFAPTVGANTSRWEDLATRWSGTYVAVGAEPSVAWYGGICLAVALVIAACSSLADRLRGALAGIMSRRASHDARLGRRVDLSLVGASACGLVLAALTAPDATTSFVLKAGPHVDLGNIPAGRHRWMLECENRGTSDATIEEVSTSCGCTVAEEGVRVVAPGRTVAIPLDISVLPGVAKDVVVSVRVAGVGRGGRSATLVSFRGVPVGLLRPEQADLRLAPAADGASRVALKATYRSAGSAGDEIRHATWAVTPESALDLSERTTTPLPDGATEFRCVAELRPAAARAFRGATVQLGVGSPVVAETRFFVEPDGKPVRLLAVDAVALRPASRPRTTVAFEAPPLALELVEVPAWICTTVRPDGLMVELREGAPGAPKAGVVRVRAARDGGGALEATLRVVAW